MSRALGSLPPPTTIRWSVALGSMLLIAFASGAAATELRPFDADSPGLIRERHQGRAFVLAFWSLYCAPCRAEIAELKSFQARHPDIPVLLVATDPPEDAEAVAAALAAEQLGDMQTWTFADEFVERIRYAVDPRWRGELPRSYFYDQRHDVTPKTGRVPMDWLEHWSAKPQAEPTISP